MGFRKINKRKDRMDFYWYYGDFVELVDLYQLDKEPLYFTLSDMEIIKNNFHIFC